MSRRKRRREPAQERVCAICGANAGVEGAPPFEWRVADVRPGYVETCSDACRETSQWQRYEAAEKQLRDVGLSPEEHETRTLIPDVAWAVWAPVEGG